MSLLALKTFPNSPKQKQIQKDINTLRKKMGMKFKEELELDELSVTGVKTKKLQMYYKKFKDAVTKTEISILNNIYTTIFSFCCYILLIFSLHLIWI